MRWACEKRGQLLRYDETSRQFVPYLRRYLRRDVASSRDGVHIAWVSYPDGVLWRAKSDGSERRPLTPAGMRAFLPSWSPDGRRIAFVGQVAGRSVGRVSNIRRWRAGGTPP